MPTRTLKIEHLSKSFGAVRAVNDLTFTVEPGRVTGFLGPNGAGKTTTLRILLGLITPTDGHALIGNKKYGEITHPLKVVGSHLESTSFHPGRSGRDHMRIMAAGGGLPPTRIDMLLDLVGLTKTAGRRVGTYSLGMRQRLGLAAALLGDPDVLILDEPANGLDPEGIRWLRSFLRHLASDGRTVFLSTHLLGEIQQMADDVVIINRGRLVTAGPVKELENQVGGEVVVGSPDRDLLARALTTARLEYIEEGGFFRVKGSTSAEVGHLALAAGLPLTHLVEETTGLENLFLSMVGGAQ